jgi:hypothetical protein
MISVHIECDVACGNSYSNNILTYVLLLMIDD